MNSLKDHIIAFLISCLIDVVVVFVLYAFGIQLHAVTAFFLGMVVAIVVIMIYDSCKSNRK